MARKSQRLWTPKDIGISIALWLDAADLNTIVLNSGNVSQWRDKSGKQNHVSQGNAASQPLYVYATATTPAYIDFTVNVPSNLVSAASPAIPVGASPRTVFAVYTPKGTASANAYLSWGNNSSTNLCQLQNFGSHDPYFGGFSADTDSGIAYATGVRMMADFAHTNSPSNAQRLAKNGGTPVTSTNTINTSSANTFEVCASNQGNGQQCWMHEILILSMRLPDAQIAVMQAYLAWKWGLQASLPTTHPYRIEQPKVTY